MKTKKGNTYTQLLAVKHEAGDLYISLRVPVTLGDLSPEYIQKMILHINEHIMQEKKPGATYEKCLEQIDLHRDQLAQAYVKLFETYQRKITPSTRTSPIDKTRLDMLQGMKDKMLKLYAEDWLSEDELNDMILPDDREDMIQAIIEALRVGDKKEEE